MRVFLLTGSDAEAFAAADDAAELRGLYQFLSLGLRHRDLWDANRDELVREWIGAHPGSRPWGWWRYDAPEGRRQLAGAGHPILDYGRESVPSWREFAGLPVLLALDATDPPVFESEPATLARLGVLTSEERRRLTPVDFEPERLDDDQDEGDGLELVDTRA